MWCIRYTNRNTCNRKGARTKILYLRFEITYFLVQRISENKESKRKRNISIIFQTKVLTWGINVENAGVFRNKFSKGNLTKTKSVWWNQPNSNCDRKRVSSVHWRFRENIEGYRAELR